MSDKERLHRIWLTLEYLFAWWLYFSDDEKLDVVCRALEDARNSEQIEILEKRVSGLETGAERESLS